MIGLSSERRFFNLTVFLTLFGSLALSTDPVRAQLQKPDDNAGTPSVTANRIDKLDEQLQSKDYLGLRQALASVPMDRRMLWLRERILNGATAFLAFPYIVDLWSTGSIGGGTDDPDRDLRIVAGLFLLYAYELIVVDGAKCEDTSAPGHRIDQLLTSFSPVVVHLKKQTGETKNKLVDLALRMERVTAPKRKDDDFLCRDGMAQMSAALASGAKPKEVPTPQGQVGRTFEVPSLPDYVPKFLASEKYGPVQQQARASMRTRLMEIAK